MNTAAVRSALKQGDLAWDLRQLGLRSGMGVLVHASLRSLGEVQGGAYTVVRALMEVITQQGTLLMPTFNRGAPSSASPSGIFDPERTPSESGAISDAFWRLSGVRRSLDPTHSFAAWGKDAAEIVAGHEHTTTMGPESPLGKLLVRGGYVLHLGTTHATSPVKHVAEMMHGAPCLGYRQDKYPVRLANGRVALHTTWRYRGSACPLTDSGELIARGLAERAVELRGRVGAAEATLAPLSACVEVVLALLGEGSGDAPPCRRCTVRPATHSAAERPSTAESGVLRKVSS